jgi:CheY-like chemotaxis protein
MENVFIISDNKNEIVNSLILHSFNLIKQKIDLLDSDKQIDSFVNKIDSNCRAIIIPIDLSPFEKKLIGLKYGMHIRLHNSKVKYLPIIFLSEYEDWQIRDMSRGIDSYNHLDYILNTKSIDVIKYSEISEELELKLNALAPLTKSSYKSDFYNHIKILPLEESGGSHSFANIWGLLRFNVALNLNALIDKKTISRTSELYFKYLTTLLEIKEQSKYESLILNAKDKKILLIDDQAKDGWEEVLKSFFRDSKFEVATNYLDGLELAKDLKWDLILLDLRLDPANEDMDGELINPKDFSGAKLLNEIKEFNSGIQVIMLTASNKSWNLKKLLELGANGYYVKESPEFNFSNEQTIKNIENFKGEVEKCFEMGFLKDLYKKINDIEMHKRISYTKRGNSDQESLKIFLEELLFWLNYAVSSITCRIDEKSQEVIIDFNNCLINLFSAVELIGNRYVGNCSKYGINEFKSFRTNQKIKVFNLKNGIQKKDDINYMSEKLGPPWEIKIYNAISFSQKVDEIIDLSTLVEKRNNGIIHPDSAKSPGYKESLKINKKEIVDFFNLIAFKYK